MYRKLFLTLIAGFLAFGSFAQNETGGYLFPQYTRISDNQDSNEEIHTRVPTVSWGGGLFFVHFFEINKRQNRMKYGFTTKKSKPRAGIRGDLVYSRHNQKWTSTYRTGIDPFTGIATTADHTGKKRLNYLKAGIMGEYTTPIARHFNFVAYGGPQISYLVKAQGGIVAWKHYDEYDYFDLPVASNDYFNRILVDFVFAAGLDYTITKWVNIFCVPRVEWSATTVEKIANFNQGDLLAYNLDDFENRKAGHNYSIAITMGVEYKLHRPQHAKTKY